MAASTVNGKLLSPLSAQPASAQIAIQLVDYDDTPVVGFNTSDSTEILAADTIIPTDTGLWTAQLVPNADIQLTDGTLQTAYRVTESGAGAVFTYWIIVTATSPAWVGSLRTTLVGNSGGSAAAGMAVAGALTVGGKATLSGGLELPTGASAGKVWTAADSSGDGAWQPAASGGVQLGADLGGTDDAPEVIETHLTNPLPVDQGGTGESSAAAAFNALSPATVLGDLIYASAALTSSRLPGNTAAVKKFLAQTGDGTNSAAPTWAGIDISDLPYQPWQFPVVTYGAKVNAKLVSDGAMAQGSNVLACTTSLPFGNAAANMPIEVEGAGPPGVSTLVTSIQSVTDSGHLVLADAASTAVANATVIWSNDDNTAVQNAVTDAVAYARAHNGYAQVLFPDGGCGIAGALSHANLGNAQVTLPIIPVTENTVTLEFRGVGTGNAIRHWQQTVPQRSGSCLISYGVYPSLDAFNSDVNTNGQSSLIGGPTGPNGYGDASFLFSNMHVVLKDISILTTYSADGLGYSGVWLWGVDQCNMVDAGFNTTAVFNNGTGELGSVGALATGGSVAIGLPATSNQNNVTLDRVTVGGGYTYACIAPEHLELHGCHFFYCWAALAVVGSWHDGSATANTSSHKIKFTQIGIEGCAHDIFILGAGASGIGPYIEGSIDCESGLSIWDDGHGGLAAARGEIHVSGTTGGTVSTSSATGLTIIDERQPNGPGAAWALGLGTPMQNPQWRWATVVLSGGSALTDVQLGNLRGGGAAPAMAAVYSQTPGALPPVTVRVPPGGWLEVVGTGSAPTATVVYD